MEKERPMNQLSSLLHEIQTTFLELHTAKEDLFWSVKMGLKEAQGDGPKKLSEAEIQLNRFLQNPENLRRLRELEDEATTEEQQSILEGWISMFAANVIEDPKGQALSEDIVHMERELAQKRGGMKLGWTHPETGEFHPASSVQLSLMMRTDPDEPKRKAAFEGLRSIEDFVLEAGFLDIVAKRNELARLLGHEDYYAWRVHVVERMSKKDIFDRLDDLADRTADFAKASLVDFARQHGESALEPWNFLYLRAGQLTEELDPYFSFGSSLERWGRSFAAMGIQYRQATLTLDLLDRKGKYENGFMHGPELAYFQEDGSWNPARINFTANAVAGQVGGGLRAIRTLFHEGGHAAHFSNILAKAPCFSHEFAPTSVAYAETQSMFLDSLLGDADWRRRYAKDKDGNAIPVELIEKAIREQQPFRGWAIRSMVTVPFAERAMYEMSDEERTPENVLNAFRKIERDLQGLNAGVRPVLSVPHLLAGEASAYYHGYVLAEMAVYQTRAFFEKRDGYLTDNPNIGPALAEHYWAPGNAASFLGTIESLTGESFSADSLVNSCNMTVDEAIAKAHASIEKLKDIPAFEGEVDLDANLCVVHGDTLVAGGEDVSFNKAAAQFETWIEKQEAPAA